MRITFITNPHSCNLNCDICFSKQIPLSWEPVREMDFAIIEKVVKAFLPFGIKEIIPSTIGEPFLYSRFEDFLELAKKYNLKVNITTNGTFPNGGIKKWAPLLSPVLSDIKFSAMHGEIPEWLRENILEFKSQVCASISIQATIAKNERHKISDLQNFVKTAGINRLKINAPWILSRPVRLCLPPRPSGEFLECKFLNKEIWVWVDGTFQVCPNPDARFGMLTKIPFGDFGNFALQEPLEIWNGKKYRDFCKNYKEHAICKFCKMNCQFTGLLFSKP